MTRLLQRLRENDPSLTQIDSEALESEFAQELKVVNDINVPVAERTQFIIAISDLLTGVLQNNTSVTHMILGAKDGFLVKIARSTQNLKSFVLCQCLLHITDIRQLTAILRNRSLEYFWVTLSSIKISRTEHFIDFLNQLYCHPSLKTFAWGNNFNPPRATDGPIFANVATIPGLNHLNVSTAEPHAFMSLWNATGIEKLVFSCPRSGDPIIPSAFALSHLLGSFSNLRELSIIMQATEAEVSEVFLALINCSKLERLQLESFYTSGQTAAPIAFSRFLKAAKSLRILMFNLIDFRESSIVARELGQCKSLQELSIMNCQADDEFFYEIANGFTGGNWTKLTSLNFEYIRDVTNSGWDRFLSALAACSTLEKLTLGYQLDNEVRLEDENSSLDQSLQSLSSHLKHLALCQNFIMLLSMTTISNLFLTLEEMDFSLQPFRDDGVITLSNAIKSSATLVDIKFDFRGSQASAQSVVELLGGIEENQSIKNVRFFLRKAEDVNANTISAIRTTLEKRTDLQFNFDVVVLPGEENEFLQDAIFLVKHYNRLVKIGWADLHQSQSKQQWFNAILDADDDVSVLYRVFRKKPNFIREVEIINNERDFSRKRQRTG